MTEELKECQLCHKSFPKSNFYKRKDRNGEYNLENILLQDFSKLKMLYKINI